jgi:hypothetical protein
MREEFLLDALVDYQIEPEDPTRTIPNPERRALDNEIRTARADLTRLEREYGVAAANNAEQRRPTMRGFKIVHSRLGKQLRKARAHLARLLDQRRKIPKRAEVRELNERAVVKLATERKHLTDIINMLAYQVESDLLALLRLTTPASIKRGEPCCMSCLPRPGPQAELGQQQQNGVVAPPHHRLSIATVESLPHLSGRQIGRQSCELPSSHRWNAIRQRARV